MALAVPIRSIKSASALAAEGRISAFLAKSSLFPQPVQPLREGSDAAKLASAAKVEVEVALSAAPLKSRPSKGQSYSVQNVPVIALRAAAVATGTRPPRPIIKNGWLRSEARRGLQGAPTTLLFPGASL